MYKVKFGGGTDMKYNNCKKCPYYGSYYDSFIGDGDEWCECGICKYGDIPSCKYPLFIRHILAYFLKKKQEKWDKEAEKSYLEEQKEEAYKLLNMSEDIYLVLEKSAEEIENIYGKETELTEEIRGLLSKLNCTLGE